MVQCAVFSMKSAFCRPDLFGRWRPPVFRGRRNGRDLLATRRHMLPAGGNGQNLDRRAETRLFFQSHNPLCLGLEFVDDVGVGRVVRCEGHAGLVPVPYGFVAPLNKTLMFARGRGQTGPVCDRYWKRQSRPTNYWKRRETCDLFRLGNGRGRFRLFCFCRVGGGSSFAAPSRGHVGSLVLFVCTSVPTGGRRNRVSRGGVGRSLMGIVL